MALFSCEIISPEKLIYRGRIEHVSVDSALGSTGIFGGHAPLISVLKPGKVKIYNESNQEEDFNIKGGFLHVKKGEVKILTPYAEAGEAQEQ